MMKPIATKLILSLVLLVIAVVVFVWRFIDPTVLTRPDGADIVYVVLVLTFIPIISVVGWFGATMTFTLEKE